MGVFKILKTFSYVSVPETARMQKSYNVNRTEHKFVFRGSYQVKYSLENDLQSMNNFWWHSLLNHIFFPCILHYCSLKIILLIFFNVKSLWGRKSKKNINFLWVIIHSFSMFHTSVSGALFIFIFEHKYNTYNGHCERHWDMETGNTKTLT